MRFFLLLFLLALLCWLPASSCAAMIVREYLPAKHDRFYAGNDKAFVGAPNDYSGVGCTSTGKWATLVSDNGFISSVHLHPSAGETVTFWTSNQFTGTSYTYLVTGGMQIGKTDIWLGWFDKTVTVDRSIARYPVAVLPTSNDYRHLVLLNYGASHRLGRNVLDKTIMLQVGGSAGVAAIYDYGNHDVPSIGGDETYLQVGDSGAPSFVVFNSRMALIGTHWGIASNPLIEGSVSIDAFIPEYFNEINKALSERGQSLNRYWWRSRKRSRVHSGT
jgi:hypothetical protein